MPMLASYDRNFLLKPETDSVIWKQSCNPEMFYSGNLSLKNVVTLPR
jgi:hypothetical protein